MFDPARRDFEFRPGPVFANLVLGDEINRAPPKTQSALLEAMQERQVTVDGVTHPLPRPFLVLATQNPIEYEGTYPLPEAQLDRFMLRVSIGYPIDRATSGRSSRRRMARRTDEVAIDPVADAATIVALQRAIEDVLRRAVRRRLHRRPRHRDPGQPEGPDGRQPAGSAAVLKAARASCRSRRPRLT